MVNKLSLRGVLISQQPLIRYNSWHVGGTAERLYQPADLADLQQFLPTLASNEPLTWIGLGSNLLIRDGGIRGVVIHTQGKLNELALTADNELRAEAGVSCAKVAKFCVRHGLLESEFFAGIPGTVGGALKMNASAFGGGTWEHVVAVETIDRQGKVRLRSPRDFQVGYREVIMPDEEWFVAGHFSFPTGDGERVQQSIKALLLQRANSQPIGKFSCGSVFRNPPGDYAARLIEASGLKGMSIGGAVVSHKHANFIINENSAKAADIEQLIYLVVKEVARKQSVQLIPEVHIIGELENEME